MNSDPNRLHQLFCAYTDERLTREEKAELQEALRQDPHARQRWFAHVDLEDGLHDLVQTRTSPSLAIAEGRSRKAGLRPLLAAAAGLALGLFSASMVFGFGFAPRVQTTALFHDSFESEETPATQGKPTAPGGWSGDHTEVVGHQGGVQPAQGNKMLRFLRGDDALEHLPDSRSSDIFRLLDVRPYQQDLADGGGVVRLSALFNATPEGVADPISCTLMLYALDARLVEGRKPGSPMPNLRRHMLAFSQTSRVKMDADATSWQAASNELRLPPETDYLMIQIGVTHDTTEPGKRLDSFGHHYADQVHVTLARLPEVPLP